MTRFGPLGLVLVPAITSLFLPSAAGAACSNGNWDLVTNTVTLQQSNGIRLHLFVDKQSGNAFSGTAAFGTYQPATLPLESDKATTYVTDLLGTISGSSLGFRLTFSHGASVGVYTATIDEQGWVVGRTYDEKAPSSSASFQSESPLKCIPLEASTPLLTPRPPAEPPLLGGLVLGRTAPGDAPAAGTVIGSDQKPVTDVLSALPGSPSAGGAAINSSPKPVTDVLKQQASIPPGNAAPTGPTPPAGFAVVCQGGGMSATTTNGQIRIGFAFAAQGSAAAPPKPGQCAFVDRAFRAGEPTLLVYAANGKDANALILAARNGGAFQVHANNNNQGALVVTAIDSLPPVANPPSTLPGNGLPTGPVGPAQPTIGGTAARLIQGSNVRNGPNGGVIGSLPAGAQVFIAACDDLWCRLATPYSGQTGWVWRQFLQFSGAGTVQQAPAGPAGPPPGNNFPPPGYLGLPATGFPPAAG